MRRSAWLNVTSTGGLASLQVGPGYVWHMGSHTSLTPHYPATTQTWTQTPLGKMAASGPLTTFSTTSGLNGLSSSAVALSGWQLSLTVAPCLAHPTSDFVLLGHPPWGQQQARVGSPKTSSPTPPVDPRTHPRRWAMSWTWSWGRKWRRRKNSEVEAVRADRTRPAPWRTGV